jgi:hypothetical protein
MDAGLKASHFFCLLYATGNKLPPNGNYRRGFLKRGLNFQKQGLNLAKQGLNFQKQGLSFPKQGLKLLAIKIFFRNWVKSNQMSIPLLKLS